MSSGMLLARRLLLALMCVWSVASSVQPQLHDLLVEHVFCAEHQALEHAPLDADAHGDICWFPGSLTGPPVMEDRVVHAVPITVWPTPLPLAGASAARAPPLSYAPKTSPPA